MSVFRPARSRVAPERNAVARPQGGRFRHLAQAQGHRHADGVQEAMGIYRGEVYEIMGALADLRADVREIVRYLLDEDDDETEEEESL